MENIFQNCNEFGIKKYEMFCVFASECFLSDMLIKKEISFTSQHKKGG